MPLKVTAAPERRGGSFPAVGDKAPAFTLAAKDLSDVGLSDFAGKRKVLNIFPCTARHAQRQCRLAERIAIPTAATKRATQYQISKRLLLRHGGLGEHFSKPKAQELAPRWWRLGI